MFVKFSTALFFFVISIFGSGSAIAQIAEVRIGITEYDERSLRFGPSARGADENSVAINAEILFNEPELLKWALTPQPYIGGTLNLEGKTSYGGAGLLWRQGFGEKFYGDIASGLVIHTGTTTIEPGPGEGFFDTLSRYGEEIQFGGRILFRQQVALGVNVSEDWSGEIFYEHLSNAGLASANEGADSLGFRVVKKF